MSDTKSVIRVLLVDDHAVVRRGLRHLLASCADIKVVGEAVDGQSALLAAQTLTPDVILLDIRMPGISGYEVAPRLRKNAPDAKIIMLTTYDDDEYLARSLGGGAHAYLLKSASDETVPEAIRAAQRGQRFVTPSLVGKVLGQFETLSKVRSRLETGLSDADIQVLGYLAEGLTNKGIALRMFVSERTVKRRVQDVTHKLGARTRAQAIVEATRRGII
jgi:DNA-binding NarL/FixJ family response regulator